MRKYRAELVGKQTIIIRPIEPLDTIKNVKTKNQDTKETDCFDDKQLKDGQTSGDYNNQNESTSRLVSSRPLENGEKGAIDNAFDDLKGACKNYVPNSVQSQFDKLKKEIGNLKAERNILKQRMEGLCDLVAPNIVSRTQGRRVLSDQLEIPILPQSSRVLCNRLGIPNRIQVRRALPKRRSFARQYRAMQIGAHKISIVDINSIRAKL